MHSSLLVMPASQSSAVPAGTTSHRAPPPPPADEDTYEIIPKTGEYRMSGEELSMRCPAVSLWGMPAPHRGPPPPPADGRVPSHRAPPPPPAESCAPPRRVPPPPHAESHVPSHRVPPPPPAESCALPPLYHLPPPELSPAPLQVTPTAETDRIMKYIQVVKKLGGAGRHLGAARYTDLFGDIHAGTPFGDRVWDGLIYFYRNQYRYHYLMTGPVRMGWFLCPFHFSKANAQLPPTLSGPEADYQYYPAVFGFDDRMACLAICLFGSRPWWVHPDRIIEAVPVPMLQSQPAAPTDVDEEPVVWL